MAAKEAANRRSVWEEVNARRQGPSHMVEPDVETIKRAYHRDLGRPARTVWNHVDDPDALGIIALLTAWRRGGPSTSAQDQGPCLRASLGANIRSDD